MLRSLVLTWFVAVPALAGSYFVELRPNARTRIAAERTFTHAFRGVVADLTPREAEALRKNSDVLGIHRNHDIDRFEPIAQTSAAAIHDARARVRASNLDARGNGITVAVIDSGIDATHPALRVAGGWDFAQNDPIPEDVEGHGTHVAGIIAANGADVLGVAPDVTLYAYKVVHHDGDGKESSLVAALERAIDPNGDGDPSDHVDVVNISLGWSAGPDSIGARAVDAATAAGIVVVVAAGNERRTPAQVKAPGVAATAITVANAITESDVILESSRGPVPGTLAFKPDLAGPGEGIVSTIPGGGTASKSGTSMASPHVAGVAALLRELHPDWTPAEVKQALISTARAMNGPPLARGAGFVDAQAAHEARFFVDGALSFGIDGARTGTFDATRTFTITNRSQAAATFNATPQSTPANVTVAITPQSFSLAPNASRSVSVRVTANNLALAFPGDSLLGGGVRLQSSTVTIDVPWGLVRAARATIVYDGAMAAIFATSPARARLIDQYAANAGEMYAPPGDAWDFVMVSDDARVHVAERVPVDDDARITFHANDASRTFALDARDATGTPLHTLPNHKAALRMTIDEAAIDSDTLSLGDIDTLRIAPHSTRFHFAPIETQLAASHAYVVMHPELTGGGATLTESADQHVRFRWPSPASLRAAAHVAYDSGSSALSTILLDSVASAPAFDVYLTSRTSLGAFAAMSFEGETGAIAMLRATGDGIAPGNGRTLSPSAHVAANGSDVPLGRGPGHPFGSFAFLGGFGETREASSMRGERTVTLGNDASDVLAPSLTSLRVLGANGAMVDRVAAGESAALRFSAADFHEDFSTRGSRPERTRVSYRAHGDAAWIPLPVVITGADLGTSSALGHVPSGDLYLVDLAAATAAAAMIDLRVEIEDAAGNRMTWTQQNAFAVGDAMPLPRRRAVR